MQEGKKTPNYTNSLSLPDATKKTHTQCQIDISLLESLEQALLDHLDTLP